MGADDVLIGSVIDWRANDAPYTRAVRTGSAIARGAMIGLAFGSVVSVIT